MGVLGERMQLELQGVSCAEPIHPPEPKKSILSSRSFGKPLTTLEELNTALIHHVMRAGAKLRDQDQQCRVLQVFVRTNPFDLSQPQYRGSELCALATSDE